VAEREREEGKMGRRREDGTWVGGPAGLKGGKRERVGGFGIFFLSSLQTFSNFKFKHLLTFQTLKLFKPYFQVFK
jgi:hypothetical protein